MTWGDVEWETDRFEDFDCEPMTFMAADQLDICAMFEEEVDRVVADGWKSIRGSGTEGL